MGQLGDKMKKIYEEEKKMKSSPTKRRDIKKGKSDDIDTVKSKMTSTTKSNRQVNNK